MVICVGRDDVGSPVSSLKKKDPILYNDTVTMRKGNGSLSYTKQGVHLLVIFNLNIIRSYYDFFK